MKYASVMALVLLASLCARADEIRLKNGGKLVGVAREEGDRVIVELGSGTARLPKSDVAEIVPGRTALHEYQVKLRELGEDASAEAVFRLAVWARGEKLSRYVTALLERVITLDPDHRGARELLGYVQHDGRWLPKQEYMEVTGHVRFRGTWVKIEEREAILTHEREATERRKQEAARRWSERTSVRRIEPPASPLGIYSYPKYRSYWIYPHALWHGHFLHHGHGFHHGTHPRGHHGHH